MPVNVAASQLPIPEAKPGPFGWEPQQSALVIIDMQRDFLESGGFGAALGNDVSRLAPIIPRIQAFLRVFRALGWPVIHTMEGHRPDLSDCPPAKLRKVTPGRRIGDPGPMGRILIQGEPGHAIIPALEPIAGELVIQKPGKGAFWQTELEDWLLDKGIAQLVVTGVTTEVCVQTTLREAADRGFDCLLVADGTESYFPAFKAAVLDMVISQGAIVGWTAPSASIIAAIARAWRSEAWEELRPGLTKAVLWRGSAGQELAFLRYRPGASAPSHRHQGRETILVLEGAQGDEHGSYGPGEIRVNEVDTIHSVQSPSGCLVLIHWEKPVEFLH